MTAYQILPATLHDLRQARALEKLCFGPDAWGYIELIGALVWPTYVRLKAAAGAQLVGLAIGDSNPYEGVGWIATIGVHPDYQRRGIGRALLIACEAALTQKKVKLTVRASNNPAITLYTNLGYKRVAVWHRYYSGGEDGIVMEKVKP